MVPLKFFIPLLSPHLLRFGIWGLGFNLMDDYRFLGRSLLLVGVVLMILGALFMFGGRILWLGHIPGDINIERRNFRFYFPISTCVIISVILIAIMWLLKRR